MSVDLTFWKRNDSFRVRIYKDGAIKFLNHDIEYDLAMVEFGEPQTNAIEVKLQWEADPVWFFVRNMETTQSHLFQLAIDFCEHAMLQLDPTFSKNSILVNSISLLRKFNDGTANELDLDKSHDDIGNIFHKLENDRAKEVIQAIQSTIALATNVIFRFESVSTLTRRSMRRYAKKELKWQIRRFVDCMASVQAGKPWPPLEATK